MKIEILFRFLCLLTYTRYTFTKTICLVEFDALQFQIFSNKKYFRKVYMSIKGWIWLVYKITKNDDRS